MSAPEARCVIGIDAGGTKTAAVLVDAGGRLIAKTRAGAANYQAVGSATAHQSIRDALTPLVDRARAEGAKVHAVAYGLAGLDRPKDETAFHAIIDRVHPSGVPRVVVNDTYLILRAGTPDGVGVAVVSGTGSNCVGAGPDGARARIGGLGHPLGDFGSGGDIGRDALGAAFRGQDGRGEPTALTGMLMERLGLERLDDLVDYMMADAEQPVQEKNIAPLVLEAAEAGDRVSQRILADAGRELGLSARLVAKQLFGEEAAPTVVLGGSVLQRGRSRFMIDALEAELHTGFPEARTTILAAPPVLGAALLGLDQVLEAPGQRLSDAQRAELALALEDAP